MGCYKGRSWVSLGGVGHVELSEGFFRLTRGTFPHVPICEGGVSPYCQLRSGWDALERIPSISQWIVNVRCSV